MNRQLRDRCADVRLKKVVSVLPNDYSQLENLPSIDGVTLSGDISSKELNLLSSSSAEYETMKLSGLAGKGMYVPVIGEDESSGAARSLSPLRIASPSARRRPPPMRATRASRTPITSQPCRPAPVRSSRRTRSRTRQSPPRRVLPMPRRKQQMMRRRQPRRLMVKLWRRRTRPTRTRQISTKSSMEPPR